MAIGTLIGMIITSVIALLVGVLLSRWITKPLQSLIQSMKKIRDGDLQTRVEIASSDEFGKVGETFNVMTEQLYRTEQARSHLVADVAHELRTPLTIIQGQLELIQQGVKQAKPEELLPIQDEVARLIQLVQDLHQLSLAEVGKLPLQRTEIDFAQLLQTIVQMYELEAHEREVVLNFIDGSRGSLSPLYLDPNRMTQVFVNLISNALSHTPAGGQVSVQLQPQADGVTVDVTDTGSGIATAYSIYF